MWNAFGERKLNDLVDDAVPIQTDERVRSSERIESHFQEDLEKKLFTDEELDGWEQKKQPMYWQSHFANTIHLYPR